MNRLSSKALYFLLCLFFAALLSPVFSQISKPSTPLSIAGQIALPEATLLAQPDWANIREEDKSWMGSFRFAVPIPVDFSMQNSGAWQTLPDGSRLWRLHLKAENALGLALSLENFEMPKGATLHLFSPDGRSVFGSYDADNNTESRKLFIGFTKGAATVLEYHEPRGSTQTADFHINAAYYAYRAQGMGGLDFGGANNCHVNINCPEAAAWQRHKQGVVRIRIVMNGGVGWCSGALMNNTAQDGKPYVLSAFHCTDRMTVDYSLTTFFFNYEAPACANTNTEPALQSLQGCAVRAGLRETDFLLLELNQRIPTTYNPLFLGWNRDSMTLPTATHMVHHPVGDVKKYSRDSRAPIVENFSITWDNGTISPANSHLRAVFNTGSMEGGSSGAPYFDALGRVVAQLHGGATTGCTTIFASGGWLAKSWNGGGTAASRLRDWLDPLSTGVQILDSATVTRQVASVSGHIKTMSDEPFVNQKISIGTDTISTNATGNYSFSNIPLSINLPIGLSKNTLPDNGVDALDLLLMRRHILDIAPLSKIQVFAGDVDDSGEMDVLDMLRVRRVILGIDAQFPKPSWRFFPASLVNDANFPFGLVIPDVLQLNFTANTPNLHFIGVKMGDVDGSADVRQ